MSYTGASCPKEEQVLLLEAKAYPLRRANCLKNNAEFSISSWDQEVILGIRLPPSPKKQKNQRHCIPPAMHLQVPTTPSPVPTSPYHHLRNPTSITAGVSISAATEGGLSLCSSSDILPSQVLTRLHTSAYLPRSTPMTLCPRSACWIYVPSLMYCYMKLKAMMKFFLVVQLKAPSGKKKNPRSKTVSHYWDQVGCNLTLPFGTQQISVDQNSFRYGIFNMYLKEL